MANHLFTQTILDILEDMFPRYAQNLFEHSPVLGYLNAKTRSAGRGSKARGAFANHYALYVVVEDYLNKGFNTLVQERPYSMYEGAKFSDLFRRQRELPFGAKLQNHALNSRLNDEFKKFYPGVGKPPIVRDVSTQRYWVQEDLLKVTVRGTDGRDVTHNIAPAIIRIIDAYVASKRAAFDSFLESCRKIASLGEESPLQAMEFVRSQLQPNVDARVFEIVSFSVLKAKYGRETIWIGETRDTVSEHPLLLFKTGRTNANDGGIDFVMKPKGRFFQVTETVDVTKYFLDIDKVQRFPITFVVKSQQPREEIRAEIRSQAVAKYKIEAVVRSYMDAIEEIINVPDLLTSFQAVIDEGLLTSVMEEIVVQSKVEFNHAETDAEGDVEDLLATEAAIAEEEEE